MEHRIVTAAQMKQIEASGAAHGLSYRQMMENPARLSGGSWPSAARSPDGCWWSAAKAITAATAL